VTDLGPSDPDGGLRVDVFAVLVGAAVGVVGTAFREGARSGYALYASALDAGSRLGFPGWILGAVTGGLMVVAAVALSRRFAPEAGGSGIQEVEGMLLGVRPALRWRVLLPVKFFGGLLGISAGLLLGREGPTIHMGGALGTAVAERARGLAERTRILAVAGSAAGLAVAFGAPFAGILFALEELRGEFSPSPAGIRRVALATITAVIVGMALAGSGRMLPIPSAPAPGMIELALAIPFAAAIGLFGVLFNAALLGTADAYRALTRRFGWVTPVFVTGAVVGSLVWAARGLTGGGESLSLRLLGAPPALGVLVLLLSARFLLFHASYATGAPGGIFAPQIAFGTIFGLLLVGAVRHFAPGLSLSTSNWAMAGIVALIAATVRTPLTALALGVEMTGNYPVLPIGLLAAFVADLTARALGGRPIYQQLLKRQLARARSAPAP
jgi:CIC family chloride channel protein